MVATCCAYECKERAFKGSPVTFHRKTSILEPMSVFGVIELHEICEGTEVEWTIKNVSSIINYERNCFESPRFFFASNSWHFRLYPELTGICGFMSLYVLKKKFDSYSVRYDIGMKKLYNSVVHVKHLGRGIIKDENKSSQPCHMKLSELQLSLHGLTFTCTLKKHGITLPSHLTVLKEPKLNKPINLNGLSQSFKSLLADKESCDTTLCVKEKEYKVHKAVLIARSSVFSAMFHNEMSEKQSSIINIPDCDPDSFQEFLEYLYCGQLEDLAFSNAFHLYSTSDKYDVQDLKAFCVECLMESLTVENVFEVVTIADKYDDTKLFSAAQECFNRNMSKILDTTEWECLLTDNYPLAKKLLKAVSSKMDYFYNFQLSVL